MSNNAKNVKYGIHIDYIEFYGWLCYLVPASISVYCQIAGAKKGVVFWIFSFITASLFFLAKVLKKFSPKRRDIPNNHTPKHSKNK